MQQLQTASRKKAKMKLGLQGASGSGKTMSALLIAKGLCNTWDRIAVVDTENGSAHLYSHLGNYKVLSLASPFSPEKYIDAIKLCETSGMEVIVLDSISHEWEGIGGILDIHGNMPGNSFTNWSKLTPRHNAFISAILQSQSHIIATIRTKQDYVLVEKNGKQVPEKVGLKGITRDGIDYELTIMLDIDIKHYAVASKDRTGIFANKPEFTINEETGKTILKWCNSGVDIFSEGANNFPSVQDITTRIEACKSVDELLNLYKQFPKHQEQLLPQFTTKKNSLESKSIFQTQKLNSNGSSNGTGNHGKS